MSLRPDFSTDIHLVPYEVIEIYAKQWFMRVDVPSDARTTEDGVRPGYSRCSRSACVRITSGTGLTGKRSRDCRTCAGGRDYQDYRPLSDQ